MCVSIRDGEYEFESALNSMRLIGGKCVQATLAKAIDSAMEGVHGRRQWEVVATGRDTRGGGQPTRPTGAGRISAEEAF